MLYYIIFSVLTLIALLEMVTVPERIKKAIYITMCIIFVMISGLRWNTGNDWKPYYSFFTRFTADDPVFLLRMEPGYVQFVKFLRIFSASFTFYLMALAIITVSIKTIFFYRYAGAVFLALVLYWGTFLGDVMAVRQSIAISLCVLATHFIITRRAWYFIICTIVAAQVHVTAYIFLLAYPIYYANWSVRYKYVFLVISIIFGSFSISENILELLTRLVPAGVGLDRVNQKALAYLEIGNEIGSTAELSKMQRLVAALAKRAVMLPIFFYFQERFTISKDKYKGFLNLYTFGNVVFFFVVDFLTLQRAATYFYTFEILMLCIIYINVKSKSVWFIIIITYALFKMISIILGAYGLLVPYIWIFSENTYRYVY
ncbi:EpsG family protein [Dyadobacter fermentans]|uniref:EpsG family protein n=1 Tax=Dyadobacter fermentans (strain ATCC 700827 / DSM 18053 / CIP 107007 / KCTC 52180 / NS114) TaxID=471854 RepID=C6W3U8_DYAFD|nr:EpsG family protein [Dyadobacter fermentans]ACT95796.1 hypothetical protein Dfer_4595 [Dyadobacter fermentans DSM 18053]